MTSQRTVPDERWTSGYLQETLVLVPPVSTCSICYISGNLYCYGANNPVTYVDPDGRSSRDFNFNWNSYILGVVQGSYYGCKAYYKDFCGKVGNYVTTLITKSEIETLYINAEISVGSTSLTGTLIINKLGETSFSFAKPTDMLLSEIENLYGMPITIDTSGVNINLPIYTGIIDINAVVGTEFDKDNCKLKLGTKIGKEADMINFIKGGLSVEGGVNVILKPSFQDGLFATVENKKSDKLNNDVMKSYYYSSIDFFIQNFE